MSNYDSYSVLGAVYDSQDVAEMEFEAVKSLYRDWQLMDDFDAAVVTKRDDGHVKIVKTHETPTRKGGWRGAGIGLATGAVIALFPAAAIGGGLLAATTAGGAAIGAVAGHVTKGMSRSDLKELGERLDDGQSGLVVVTATDRAARIKEALVRASAVIDRELQALEDELDAEVAEAQADAPPDAAGS